MIEKKINEKTKNNNKIYAIDFGNYLEFEMKDKYKVEKYNYFASTDGYMSPYYNY